ncbi:MAG: flavodoxin family protein [Promethearchaeota archaeon]
MKILVLNGSPRMDKSNTSLILTPFIEGMKEVGADVELFYIRKLNIKSCLGCFNCWLKTPGKCSQNDDMQILYPKLREADIWVFAAPVYVDGIPGSVKTLIDRFIPLVEPFFELREGHCRHIPREENKASKLVLISNCGFWEKDNFDPLLVHMRAFAKNASIDFAGALLRPHGEALTTMKRMGVIEDIFEAAKEAGRQLVKNGEMSTETLHIVSRELLPLEQYIQAINQNFQQALEALEKK